jgi:N-acetyl-anhydromuramyl-L-alanine amidase AmpD
LEQVELKHCEFVRLVNSLKYTSSTWESAASSEDEFTGRRAYALKQMASYDTLSKDAVAAFRMNADPGIINGICDFETITYSHLLERIKDNREKVLQKAGIFFMEPSQ